jgi:hypothetical protein
MILPSQIWFLCLPFSFPEILNSHAPGLEQRCSGAADGVGRGWWMASGWVFLLQKMVPNMSLVLGFFLVVVFVGHDVSGVQKTWSELRKTYLILKRAGTYLWAGWRKWGGRCYWLFWLNTAVKISLIENVSVSELENRQLPNSHSHFKCSFKFQPKSNRKQKSGFDGSINGLAPRAAAKGR